MAERIGGYNGGRRPGARNKKTLRAIEFAQRFLEDEAYQDSVRERITSGDPQWQWLEELVWAYAFGKPVQNTTTHITGDPEQPVGITFVDYRAFFNEATGGRTDTPV